MPPRSEGEYTLKASRGNVSGKKKKQCKTVPVAAVGGSSRWQQCNQYTLQQQHTQQHKPQHKPQHKQQQRQQQRPQTLT
jgi:hypothetical protein